MIGIDGCGSPQGKSSYDEAFRLPIHVEYGAKTADPKDFVDPRFLEEFNRSGFIDGLYH